MNNVPPSRYTRGFEVNPEYLDYLEKEVKKLDKIRSAIDVVNSWIKDETLGLYPSQIYLSAIKDIRRHINS